MAQEIADSKLLDTWSSSGTKIEPDITKIIEGWQLGEQPPHEYMNWLQNTFGSKLNHILKNGIIKWNDETEYLAGSSVQHNSNVWICKNTNTNSEPTDLNANWEKVAISKDLTVTVNTITDLRSISYPAATVWASGYHTKNDGAFGSHIFRLKGVKTTETDTGGTVIIATINAVDYVYELQFSGAVNVKWFGAKGDGVTNDTDSIQSALDNYKNIYIPTPISFYLVEAQLSPKSNTFITGAGAGCYIKSPDASTNIIYAVGVSGVTITGVHFSTASQLNPTAYISFINIRNCYNFKIINNYFDFQGFRAIYLLDSSDSVIENNYIGEGFGAIQDSADIALIGNSNRNKVVKNYCKGKNLDHGILIQDPYTSSTPTSNTIDSNVVSEHNAYGIVVYVTTNYDTKTKVINNEVYGILGTQLMGASGAGIYIQRAGGTLVHGNNVYNCCLSTNNFGTLGMACVVANGSYASGGDSIIVSNNTIHSTKGPGIGATSNDLGVVITNNNIFSEDDASILVSSSQNITITGNTIRSEAPGNYGINILSVLPTIIPLGKVKNTNISDNRITTVNSAINLLVIDTVNGGFESTKISGNIINVTGPIGRGIKLDTDTDTSICNNKIKANGYCISVSPSGVNTFISGNTLISPAVWGFSAGGNSSGYMDATNNLQTKTLNNSSGKFNITRRGSTPPVYNTAWSNIGDRVIQDTPAVGSPKGWVCTVAGNPGTWVSEGNL